MNIDWRAAIESAGHAPSIHNTQPWRFVAAAGVVELWADRRRAVPAIDPTGRQLVVSCGAALEYLCIDLVAAGHQPSVELAPDPESDLLATVRVTGPADPDPETLVLAANLHRRATVRTPFDDDRVPPEVLDRLGVEVRKVGGWLRTVTDRDDLITLTVLLQHAHEAQLGDPSYVEEIERWRRPATAADGIPDDAVPEIAGRHSNLAIRDFNPGHHDVIVLDGPVRDERPAIAVIGTTGDSVSDWLTAGRATARLLLAAAACGVAASPLNQVIDDPGPRRQLQSHLGLIGYPQMVLRLGYAAMTPTTGRRPVDEYLTYR